MDGRPVDQGTLDVLGVGDPKERDTRLAGLIRAVEQETLGLATDPALQVLRDELSAEWLTKVTARVGALDEASIARLDVAMDELVLTHAQGAVNSDGVRPAST